MLVDFEGREHARLCVLGFCVCIFCVSVYVFVCVCMYVYFCFDLGVRACVLFVLVCVDLCAYVCVCVFFVLGCVYIWVCLCTFVWMCAFCFGVCVCVLPTCRSNKSFTTTHHWAALLAQYVMTVEITPQNCIEELQKNHTHKHTVSCRWMLGVHRHTMWQTQN